MTRKLFSLALVAACLSACTAARTSRQSTPANYIAQTKRMSNLVPGPASHELADFLRMPGDRAVVVPNGVYHASDIDAPHAATAGPYKGWLVLVAQNRGGVVVDMANARLWLGPNTSRVMFVGFSFVNGSLSVEGHDIAFWYTDHSFPVHSWAQNGDYRSPDAVHAYASTTNNVRFYGSDVHDVCDAFDVSNSTGTTLEGVHIWGTTPSASCHNDAIDAVAGNTRSLTVLDSWIQGRVTIEDLKGPDIGMLFENDWVSNSPSVGFTFTSDKSGGSRGIFGTRVNVRSWGHRSGDDRTEIIGGVQAKHADNTVPSRVFVSDRGVSTLPPPPGALSPPSQWRIDHPYDAWPQVIAGA